ncbi:MAG: stage sporulation protein [Halanaerobiales bacterium]|nr:stage sporulation protein [Halanaerobiales bacterium]
MKKQSFLQGALILMIAGFINRIMGFLLRIILVRLVGDEGLGLFQMVYPLFMTLLLISTAGFPVSISKLIPERLAKNNLEGSYDLLKVTLVFVCLTSFTVSLLLYFSAEFIAEHIYSDERTYLIILAIIPCLFMSPMTASFRGFFQGFHTMIPTALSQIVEQLSRVAATLILIDMVSYLGLKYQAASIALGISIGEFSGLLILIILFIHHLYSPKSNTREKTQKIKQKSKHNYFNDLKEICSLAIPITLGRIVNSLMISGEAILIPRQLQISGFSVKEATSLYGQLSGMVEQLLYLPTVITIALTTSLIPNISDAYARNNIDKIKNNYQDVIRITTYLGLPITIIFFTRGSEICQLLFGYPEAGTILAIMAFSSTFIYFLQVSSGMLNGLGKPQLALLNLSIGSLLKLIGIFFLTRQPELGIQGAAISISLGYMLSALLNFITIGHNIGYGLNVKQCFLKPMFSSSILLIINPYLTKIIKLLPYKPGSHLETLIVLFLLIIIYLLIMVLIRAITPEDLDRFKNKGK